MVRHRWALLRLVLFVGLLSGCSQTPNLQNSVGLNAIRNAKAVPINVAQALAIDAQSEGITLSVQATLNTYTIPAVDFYGSPLVYINITAPEVIKDPWSFAATLDGKEWPQETPSSWGITITGATELSAPVSMIETGLGSLLNHYKTVRAMGGPSQFSKVVAVLSSGFLLQDKSGNYWDPTTQAKVAPEVLAYYKQRYDEIMQDVSSAGYADMMAREWKRTGLGVDAVKSYTQPDGNLDVSAYAARLRPTATYRYTGNFNNPEYQRDTVLGRNGGAQYPSEYGRSGQKWQIWNCDGFGPYSRDTFGCGPGAFAALLDFHFTYKGRTVMLSHRTKHTRTRLYQTITQPVSSDGNEPLLTHYLGTCWFGGNGATSASGLLSGMEKFIRYHGEGFHVRGSWPRGLWIPGNVGPKLDLLLFARGLNIPALVEYPSGGGQIHYSIARSFKAEQAGSGLYVTPGNYPNILVNMGDSLNGETGIFTIY